MKIAVAKEIDPSEPRVAVSPDTVKKFKALGVDIAIEPGAGIKSGLPDSEFTAAGATVSADALKDADIVIKVKRPEASELANYKRGALVIAIMDPYGNDAALKAMADAGVAAFAMELMPRITRAQSMDVLSSQANLAGYRAVIEGAEAFGRAFPMMMTAAGTIPAAQSVRDGRRRRRPAGDRDRAAARRRRHRDRRASRHQGAGRKPRRQIPRGRGRGVQERPDRRRLRQGNVERVSGQAGRAHRRAHQEAGHRHHHRADPGPAGAEARQRRDGEVDEAGLGAGRSRGRAWRQCRGRQGRRSRRRRWRQDRRLHQCRRPGRGVGVEPLCAQSVQLHRDAGRQDQQGARGELGRRTGQSHRTDQRRRRHSSEFSAES